MQVIISGAALQSALLVAPKADIRYYLNGVYVEWTPETTRIVSTDGHVLYITDEKPTGDANIGTGCLLIPRDALEAVKPKANGSFPHYVLTVDPSEVHSDTCTRYECKLRHIADRTTTEFLSGEGKYPDYTRVIPSFAPIDFLRISGDESTDTWTFQCDTLYSKPTITLDCTLRDRFMETMNTRETLAHFDFDYLTLAMKVHKVHNGNKAKSPRLYQNGYKGGLIKFTDNAYLVIMPMRQDTDNPPLLDNFRTRIDVVEEKPLESTQEQA